MEDAVRKKHARWFPARDTNVEASQRLGSTKRIRLKRARVLIVRAMPEANLCFQGYGCPPSGRSWRYRMARCGTRVLPSKRLSSWAPQGLLPLD